MGRLFSSNPLKKSGCPSEFLRVKSVVFSCVIVSVVYLVLYSLSLPSGRHLQTSNKTLKDKVKTYNEVGHQMPKYPEVPTATYNPSSAISSTLKPQEEDTDTDEISQISENVIQTKENPVIDNAINPISQPEKVESELRSHSIGKQTIRTTRNPDINTYPTESNLKQNSTEEANPPKKTTRKSSYESNELDAHVTNHTQGNIERTTSSALPDIELTTQKLLTKANKSKSYQELTTQSSGVHTQKDEFNVKFFSTVAATNHTKADDTEYLIRTEGCSIRKFDPFDPSIFKYYSKLTSPFEECHKESYIAVEGNTLVLNLKKIEESFGNVDIKCKYKAIIRDNEAKYPDYHIKFKEVKNVSFGTPIEDEFLAIKCYGNEDKLLFDDYVAFTVLKPKVEERCNKLSETNLSDDYLNIIMIAIDSTSKLNFLRQFPKTKSYIKNDLQAFDFEGYVKVADNTYINIVPMLAGHFVDEYGGEKYYYDKFCDDMPLVWKEFASLGYRTLFIEDSPDTGTFSYLKAGFQYQPTDYFLRPFAMAVEDEKWRTNNGKYCFGHTSETEYFYGYTRGVMRSLKDRPYFTFTFISRPTHDSINTAGYVDDPTHKLLIDLNESGILNKSALFVFSDHGQRLSGIVSTYIGKIEERMPFMFQHYPQWFLDKHPTLRRNLHINQKRLTTPFDVHKTLQDLVSFSSKNNVQTFKQENVGFGVSLFEEITTNRTCEDAHIPVHWCTCKHRMKVWTRDWYVTYLAEWMVKQINEWTKSTANDSKCVLLKLQNITEAYVSQSDSKTTANTIMDYLIVVKVSPSDALFEGTLRYHEGGKVSTMGDFSRINLYGKQSWCTDDHRLKKFCYCRKQL